MSGRIRVVAIRGEERGVREFHWRTPPHFLVDKSNLTLQKALTNRPFRLDDPEQGAMIAACTDSATETPRSDKASQSLTQNEQAQERICRVADHRSPGKESCNVHNNNNLRAASKDYCQGVSKLAAYANITRVGSHAANTLDRLWHFCNTKVVRLEGLAPVAKHAKVTEELMEDIFLMFPPIT